MRSFMDVALRSGGTFKCNTDHVDSIITLAQAHTMSMVDRMLGPLTNPTGSDEGRVQRGVKEIMMVYYF